MDETPKSRDQKTRGISRRDFARRAAIASAVASMAPATALTMPTPLPTASADVAAAFALSRASREGGRLSDPSGKSSPAPQQPPELAKLSPESRAEVEARIQTILSQYGSRFSDAQKGDLRRLCILAQPPLDRLRAYALENGDGPALYLKPLVEREKNPLDKTRVGKTPNPAQDATPKP